MIEQKNLYKIIENETENLKYLHSKGIVRFIENFEDKGNHFLVMELFQGVTLSDFIFEKGIKNIKDKIKLDICRRVNALLLKIHGSGLSHRDIKCDNIMIDYDSKEDKI